MIHTELFTQVDSYTSEVRNECREISTDIRKWWDLGHFAQFPQAVYCF